MTEDWLIASLQGIVNIFLHPVLYFSIIISLIIGYFRVKHERRDFNIRIYNTSQEIRYVFPQGLMMGLILSLVILGVGLVLPTASIPLIAAVTLLCALTLRLRLISPAYTIGITFLVIIFLAQEDIKVPIFSKAFGELDQTIYPSLAILMGLLIIAEGILISKNGVKRPSPKLIVSKRGQVVGCYTSKKVWMIPLFILIPGGSLAAPFDWYPVFTIGDLHVTPLLVPFLIGFSQTVQGSLPAQAIRSQGRKVLALGIGISGLAIAGNWYPFLAIGAVILAVAGREMIHYFTKTADLKNPLYFSQSKLGVKILAVIPHSPAERMGLEMGEVITKMNGLNVSDEREFYKALQINRAHCKVEVIGNNEQIRFVQRALFENEHHELGIIFTEDLHKENDQAI